MTEICYISWFLSLQGIEGVDFPELRPLLAPLMHTVLGTTQFNIYLLFQCIKVCLVYANSSYYNTTARIIVLMQVRLGSSFPSVSNNQHRKLVIFSSMLQEDFWIQPQSFKSRYYYET